MKHLKLAVFVATLCFVGVGVGWNLFLVKDYFNSDVKGTLTHRVFDEPRVSFFLIYKELDSSKRERAERAWLYFYRLPEHKWIRNKMFEWAKNMDREKRLMAYKYFSRNNWESSRKVDRSCISENDYEFFVNSWNIEISNYCLSMLTIYFAQADIPLADLNDVGDKMVFVNLIQVLRDHDRNGIESLIAQAPEHLKEALRLIVSEVDAEESGLK